MVMEAFKKVMTLLMQLTWKVVNPEDLELGDHTYTYRLYGLYSHHGIYVGNGYVIHYNPTENRNNVCPSLSDNSHKQHNCPDFPDCETNQDAIKRGVVKTCVDCFRRYGKRLQSLHRYEYGWPRLGFMLARPGSCTMLSSTKSPDQVVKRAAEIHADKAFGNYCLINNNCEHFAVFCRTDIRKSEQTAFISNCGRKIIEAKERMMRSLWRN